MRIICKIIDAGEKNFLIMNLKSRKKTSTIDHSDKKEQSYKKKVDKALNSSLTQSMIFQIKWAF